MHLEIPTFNNQTEVMYYDVLMKLCHQAIKIHFMPEALKKLKIRLKVMKKLGALLLHNDTLECIHYKNPTRKEQYDIDLIELFEKIKEKTPKAELVQ